MKFFTQRDVWSYLLLDTFSSRFEREHRRDRRDMQIFRRGVGYYRVLHGHRNIVFISQYAVVDIGSIFLGCLRMRYRDKRRMVSRRSRSTRVLPELSVSIFRGSRRQYDNPAIQQRGHKYNVWATSSMYRERMMFDLLLEGFFNESRVFANECYGHENPTAANVTTGANIYRMLCTKFSERVNRTRR